MQEHEVVGEIRMMNDWIHHQAHARGIFNLKKIAVVLSDFLYRTLIWEISYHSLSEQW